MDKEEDIEDIWKFVQVLDKTRLSKDQLQMKLRINNLEKEVMKLKARIKHLENKEKRNF